MKSQYPCNMMQDLMPLYYDGVCSRESAEAVKTHLAECSDCREYYEKICADVPGLTSFMEEDKTFRDDEREQQKTASLLAVRKRLRIKQILLTISGIALFCLMAGIIVITLRHTERKIACSANLTVSMTEKGLIGRLKGDAWNSAHTKRVDVEKDGRELTYLFFYLSGNLWGALFTDQNSYMEYTICPEDKGADRVDCVYYYTGDYSGIEMMGYEQLQEVIKEATLLWSSEGKQ